MPATDRSKQIIEEVVGEIDVGYDFDEYTPRKRHQFVQVDDGIFVMDVRAEF